MNFPLPEKKINLSSQTIMPRVARADQTAVQECVELYGDMIWALAKQMTGSVAEAEKIVPEIFADIWQNASECNSENYEEELWIALIALRRLSGYAPEEVRPEAETVAPIWNGETQRLTNTALVRWAETSHTSVGNFI